MIDIPLSLTILLLTHIFGAFYLPYGVYSKKQNQCPIWVWIGINFLLYAACLAAVLFYGVGYSLRLLVILTVICAVHFMLSVVQINWERKWVFSLSHSIRFVVIILAWWFFGREIAVNEYMLFFADYLFIALGLLLSIRPVGLLVESGDVWDAGGSGAASSRMIGYLERIVIFALLLNNQYTAIAFVITAKSITRFKENEKGRLQADYYIIGTLLSVTSVIVITFLLGLV